MAKLMFIELGAAPNPDYRESEHKGSVRVPKVRVPVTSMVEASNVAQRFIAEHDLGGGNWAYGNVVDSRGKVLGRVSYNGRVWDPKGNEIVVGRPAFGSSGRSDVRRGPVSMDPTMGEVVQRAKDEIVHDVIAGRVPPDVGSFTDMHDHVDANEYGGLRIRDLRVRKDVDALNRLQLTLDQWIRKGGLKQALGRWTLRAVPSEDYPGTLAVVLVSDKNRDKGSIMLDGATKLAAQRTLVEGIRGVHGTKSDIARLRAVTKMD